MKNACLKFLHGNSRAGSQCIFVLLFVQMLLQQSLDVKVVPVSDWGLTHAFHSTCSRQCPLCWRSERVLHGPRATLDSSPGSQTRKGQLRISNVEKKHACLSVNQSKKLIQVTSDTFSKAGSSTERSWTLTGRWARIFSFTASSSSWSCAGVTQGVSSSMVLLWWPSSLEKNK